MKKITFKKLNLNWLSFRQSQWLNIFGQAGTGKTSLLIKMYDQLIKAGFKTAVILIGERQAEFNDWEKVPINDIIQISYEEDYSKHSLKTVETAFDLYKKFENYDAVIIDSLTGLYNMAIHNDEAKNAPLDAGGFNTVAIEVIIQKFLKKIKENKLLITSLIYSPFSTKEKGIATKIKSLCDAEIFLDKGLADLKLFPAINPFLTKSRKMEKFATKKTVAIENEIRNFISQHSDEEIVKVLYEKEVKNFNFQKDF